MTYSLHIKRALDFALALLLLILAFPLILVAAIAIALNSKGSVFFTQDRVGLNGKAFKIYKLRTMSVDPRRALTQTTHSDPEVFFIGKVLRRLKIDELPQIFNVLIGDMSFVGPRPCMDATREEMPAWARRRFLVRPGMTGLAQINGNVALSWEERWRHDIHYIDNCSFLQDLVILIKTVRVVVAGEERYRRVL